MNRKGVLYTLKCTQTELWYQSIDISSCFSVLSCDVIVFALSTTKLLFSFTCGKEKKKWKLVYNY